MLKRYLPFSLYEIHVISLSSELIGLARATAWRNPIFVKTRKRFIVLRAVVYEPHILDFDFDEALRERRMAPIFAGLVKLPMYRTDETLWNSWGGRCTYRPEVAQHEYLLKIVAAGSKKLFMDLYIYIYINIRSLIQSIKFSTANERLYRVLNIFKTF